MNSHLNKDLTDFNEDELIELTKKLVSIPSYHGLPVPEKEVAEYIRDFFLKEEICAETIKVSGERPNVIASYGSGKNNEKTLMLNGHLDTVDVANMTIDPFRGDIRDGNIYGRGVVDMKGAIAAMIMAMVTLKRAGIELAGQVHFTGVADEEFWNVGTKYIIKNGPKTQYAIVGEPTNMEIHLGHRGLEWIEVKVQGKYAHGGTPGDGINAIEKMNKIVTRIQNDLLEELKKRRHPVIGPANLNLGVIRGGTQPSTVAGDCILQLDRRWLPNESPESIAGELREIIEDLKKSDPELNAEVSFIRDEGNKMGFPPLVCAESSLVVQALKEATSNVLGQHKYSYFPAWTDGGLLNHYGGIETIVFGPGHLSSAHSEKEFCPVKHIIDACKIYIMAILGVCA